MATDPATQQAYEERPLPLAAAIDLDRELAAFAEASERWKRAMAAARRAAGAPDTAAIVIDDARRPVALRWLAKASAPSTPAAVAPEVTA